MADHSLTRADIVSANPEIEWRDAKLGKRMGLIGKAPDGTKMAVMWLGQYQTSFAWPCPASSVTAAWENLKSFQPGKEFPMAGDDSLAARMRKSGLRVIANEVGATRAVGWAH